MTQEEPFEVTIYLQFNVTEVTVLAVNYLRTSFSYKSPVKFDLNFWIRFLVSNIKNHAINCVEKLQSFLNSNPYLSKHSPLAKSLVINCTPRNSHRVCNDLVSCCMVVSWCMALN